MRNDYHGRNDIDNWLLMVITYRLLMRVSFMAIFHLKTIDLLACHLLETNILQCFNVSYAQKIEQIKN